MAGSSIAYADAQGMTLPFNAQVEIDADEAETVETETVAQDPRATAFLTVDEQLKERSSRWTRT